MPACGRPFLANDRPASAFLSTKNHFTMRKRSILNAWAACLLAVLATACSGTPKYARLIPDDAVVVVRVDARQIARKSAMADNQEQQDLLDRLLRSANLGRAAQDKLEAVIADPAESGVDLSEPLFFFAADGQEKQACLLGAVSSREKLTELLDVVAKESGTGRPTEQDGYTCADFKGAVMVYNDDWFVLNGGTYGQTASDIVADVNRRFEAGETGSLAGNEAFKEMCKSPGDMQLLLLGKGVAALPGIARNLGLLEKQLPAGVRLEDFALLTDLNCDDGEAVLTARALALTDKARTFLDESGKGVRPVEGKELGYVPRTTLFAAAGNVNGSELLSQVEKQGALKEMDSQARQIVTDALNALDGDVTFSLNSMNEKGQVDLSLYAKVKNATFLRSLMKDYLDSGFVSENAPDQYQMTLDYQTEAYFGVKNGTFYFSTNESATGLQQAASPVDAADFKGKLVFMRLYPENILALPAVSRPLSNTPNGQQVRNFLDKIESIELMAESPNESRLRLVLKEKDKNVLQVFCEETTRLVRTYANV